MPTIHDRAAEAADRAGAFLSDLDAQRRDRVLYPLQPKQLEFVHTFARYRLFGGAKGGGKSYAMRAEAVRQAMSAPNVRGLILRRTFPEVRKNTLDPMILELRASAVEFRYNGLNKQVIFPNGSSIEFSYCRNFQDVARYQGIEYDFICIEELTHWKEDEFKIIKSCLRSSRVGIIPNFFASTNPGGVGHAWVRRIWINRAFEKGETPEDYAFVSANVYDNYVLMHSQPEYMMDLEDLPDTLREAFLHGNWDVFEGQYFPEFRREDHVVTPFYPNDGIKLRLICLDYGYLAPSCVLWMAIDNQNKVYVYRELYVTEHTYSKLAAKIAAMTPPTERREIKTLIADPAIVNKRSDTTGTTGKNELEKNLDGIKVLAGNNRRIDGWLRVRQHLQLSTNHATGLKEPLLVVTENCQNLIRTLPELIYDQSNNEDCDTKKEDHAPDCLRYGLMHISSMGAGFAQLANMNNKLTKGNVGERKTDKPTSAFFKKDKKRKEYLIKTNF